MTSVKIALSVLAGAAVGATLGILFAPDKGSSTRKRISKKGHDYAEELKELFNEFVQNAKMNLETMNEETRRASENQPAGKQDGKTKAQDNMAEVIAGQTN